jgi:hypothetical protein
LEIADTHVTHEQVPWNNRAYINLTDMSWKLGEKTSGVLLMLIGSASVVATGLLVFEQKTGTNISADFRKEVDQFSMLVPASESNANKGLPALPASLSRSSAEQQPVGNDPRDPRMAREGRGKGYSGR